MTTGAKMIIGAFFLLLVGAGLPFLMVMDILESTWFLNFFTYGCQVAGLILGFIGIGRLRANR